MSGRLGLGLRRHRRAWMLCLLALVVYAPAITWGLPDATAADRYRPWGPDELAPMGFGELHAVFLADTPRFDPRYPLLPYEIQALAVSPVLLLIWLMGGLRGVGTVYPFGLQDPASAMQALTLAGRLPSLLAAAGVVVVAYWTGRRLEGARGGVLTALVVMLMFPMFYYGRTSNVDMLALFWVALASLLFVIIGQEGLTVRRGCAFAVCAACAVATKDPGYAAMVPLAGGIAWLHLCRSERRLGWQTVRPLLVVVAVGLAGYAVASGIIFSPARFREHVAFIQHGSASNRHFGGFHSAAPSVAGYVGLLEHVVEFLRASLGTPTLLLGIVGAVWASWTDALKRFMALSALGVLVGVILPAGFVYFRFVLIIAYVLAVFAGWTIARALNVPTRWQHVGAWIVLGVCVSWSTARGVDLTYQMLNDSRYRVAKWFQENARPGDRVGHPDHISAWRLPHLEADIRTVQFPKEDFEVHSLPPGPPPEFIIDVPSLDIDRDHDAYYSDAFYRGLLDGTLGYVLVVDHHTPALFHSLPIPYVNPRVRVFARADRASEMTTLVDAR